MKRITFDYSGKLFGQANGNSQPEKLIKIKNEFGTMKKTINKTSKNIE